MNGNMTGDGTNTYTWNARDELASISGGATASFVYDGLGRRRGKTVAGVQTGFVYDGENFVEELNGATVTASLVTGGIDELFARKEGSTASYPLTDALGSVIGLTDGSGVLQTQYSYEPYGKATRSGATTTNSQTYTGREDDGTGVYYYRARYYSPGLARFVSSDPVGLAGGANVYAYVGQDPISQIDPLGLANGPAVARLLRGDSGGSADSFAACIERRRWDWGNELFTIANLANTAANATTSTGQGFSLGSHSTSWQHRAASRLGQSIQRGLYGRRFGSAQAALSKGGRFVGRAAIVPLIWEGWWDVGTLMYCGCSS